MLIIQGLFLVLVVSILLVSFTGPKAKGQVTIISVIILSVITGIVSVKSLSGTDTAFILKGSVVTGEIPIVIDPLAAWFMLIINFTYITGVIYGTGYMKAYSERTRNLSLHWINFILSHASLLAVCILRNSLVFLISWEIMALSTFFLVIFEGQKAKTIKAGINYLIQSHIAVLLLTIAFVWVFISQNSFDFGAIQMFALTEKPTYSLALAMLFFTGFGIKAGFVPFHTWLPHAHPAAPSHISGMMSGVLIKIGIYGILRMIILLNVNYIEIGYFILFISVLTGVYGVMLAIVQHNLKRLLAFHSIENIGIIGIGIGLGCIGMGKGSATLAVLGFSGALLHTLNHSLFKSLLFYSAGNVYQALHTMNIEKSGGLIRKMPHTALLFLIGALAICGLPPFNGFVSEFIIYSGLFRSINSSGFPSVLIYIFALFGLSLIGGLAILCFTKAFGVIFLGLPKNEPEHRQAEAGWQMLVPMYLIGMVILAIGIFPQPFIDAMVLPVELMTRSDILAETGGIRNDLDTIRSMGLYSSGFIVLTLVVYFFRNRLTKNAPRATGDTWGCGYIAPNPRMQYTASSFVRSYSKLAGSLLSFNKIKKDVSGIFPGEAGIQTAPQDKTEEILINRPIRFYQHLLGKFSFLQNGKLQFYILYGMMFIIILITIPLIINLFNR